MAVVAIRKAATASPPPPPVLSPERRDLAEAIIGLREAEATHDALMAANEWDGIASVAERTAREALEQAQTALDRARQDAASRLVSASVGTPSTVTMTVRDARAALEQAQDDIDAAVAARATLRDRIAPAAEVVRGAQWRLDRCLLAVLHAESADTTRTLVEDLWSLFRQVADKGAALHRLISLDVIKDRGPDATPGVAELDSVFQNLRIHWAYANRAAASPSAVAWSAAVAALKTDAGAALPT